MQVAGYGRSSSVHFTPDPVGDLFFNGVSSDVARTLYSGGLQADASYNLGEKHTIRGGLMLLDESVSVHVHHRSLPGRRQRRSHRSCVPDQRQ